MTRLQTYTTLERLGPVIRTGEAAAALRTSVSSTSRMLRSLEENGLARRVRSGVWSVGPDSPDPFMIAPELTRPHLAYVSFDSALNYHGMIDQIPREVSVASLDRARRITTNIGTFAIHHLPPELFGGWQETRRGSVAGPRKRSSTSATRAPPTAEERAESPSSSFRRGSISTSSKSGRRASRARGSAPSLEGQSSMRCLAPLADPAPLAPPSAEPRK